MILAHHALVSALPVLVPALVLVVAFGLVVLADRRKARRSAGEDPTGVESADPQERDQAR